MAMTSPTAPGITLCVSSRLLDGNGLASAAARARSLGFDGIELWIDHLRGRSAVRALRRTLDEIGIKRFVHLPFHDLNPCSINPRIRRVSLDEMKRALDTAHTLGAPQAVMHPGHASTSKGDTEGAWPYLIESVAFLDRHAEQRGLRIAIEIMEDRPKELLVRPEEVARLLSELPDLHAGLCLDLAHAWTIAADGADAFIERFGRRITHIHISNVREGRIHLPLDQGTLPVTPMAEKFMAGFAGPVTLEGAGREWTNAAEVGVGVLRTLLHKEVV